MKKFFHRFSTTADKGAVGAVDALARQREEEAMGEKVRLDEGKERVSSGERVKALAARFETMAGGGETRKTVTQADSQPLPLLRSSSSNRGSARTVTPKTVREHSSPRFNIDKALPPVARSTSPPLLRPSFSPTTRHARLVGEGDDTNASPGLSSSPVQRTSLEMSGMLHLPSSTARPAKEGRDVSCASGSSAGSGGHQMAPKTVAFAPSPKKPTRPSSPAAFPMGVQEVGQTDSSMMASSSSMNVGNFARATLASTARARSISKQGTAEMSPAPSSAAIPHTSPIMGPPPSRPSSSTGTSRPQPRRSNSSSTPGRRAAGVWSGAGENGMPTISQPQIAASYSVPVPGTTSPAGPGMASSLSLTHGAGDSYSHLLNSIPFVSAASFGSTHLRSASPQSIGTNSSMPASQRPLSGLGSRRGSWTGRLNSTGSASQGWASSGAKSIGGPSWSEMTQEDLVCNLGARERTRQEVLWEIVASEERYVRELERTKELYLDALLHPLRFSAGNGTPESASVRGRNSNSLETNGELPIAARFMGSEYGNADAATPVARLQKDEEKSNNPRQTLGETAPTKEQRTGKAANPRRWSNSRLGQASVGSASSQAGYGIAEGLGLSVPLPQSLRIALESISSGMLEGHSLLSEALKQRYEEQWPLVRSLADVFSRFADLLGHYKEYVMHLERALDSLEEAALMERAMRGKRLKKEKLTMTVGLGRAVASLESAAAERGECNLAIFLAMPFQRLLKYPLLFQNLLFHTDASTYEFESTVGMVVGVEEIVRSIEDEKANKEERDKTIDAFARIDGIKDKALLRPKADRLVIEERALYEENPRRAISESNEAGEPKLGAGKTLPSGLVSQNASSPGTLRAALKSKRSYRRLSDFLTTDNQSTKAPNMGSKRDIWLVRFSDVELKCQRVGVTALPMVSSGVLQQPLAQHDGSEEMGTTAATDEEAKMKNEFKRTRESKERMKALRNTTLRSKTRNLYKFIAVTSWKQVQRELGTDDDGQVDGLSTPHEVDEEEEEEDDAGDEDDDRSSSTSQETDVGVLDSERYVRQSKLSFSYWGHDKVEPKPLPVRSPQPQHASSVAAFRARDNGPGPKRHSLTPPSNTSTPALPSSTKVVASNSHAKAKVDKFAGRLRQVPDGGLYSTHRSSSNARLPSASKASILASTTDVGVATQLPQARTLHVPSQPTPVAVKHRPSFMRDQSEDSNLELLGSLIDGGGNRLRR